MDSPSAGCAAHLQTGTVWEARRDLVKGGGAPAPRRVSSTDWQWAVGSVSVPLVAEGDPQSRPGLAANDAGDVPLAGEVLGEEDVAGAELAGCAVADGDLGLA